MQWADFPFSAIGEQFGLSAARIVIGLFGIVLLRIWRIAQPVTRHARHLPVRRGVHDGAVADVPEHGHDASG